ncbi:PIG-L family deacetylase [Arcticibacterium luteifluviistationis]|nr:PIG-L family deacetylase [Arcticibacterium luteifluviistationis]
MKKLSLLLLLLTCFIVRSFAQNTNYSTGSLLQGLDKLNVVGTALYIAAHPDDENTLLITWLANEKKVRTGYIAMTRGDGGQNLIGTEKGDFAGLLRTQELLGARGIDGGEQFFTRANDFGYSKTTEEALETWGKEKVLSDLVYRIRKFQPDVLITRFPPDERAGHGHHSASSLLAEEAFDAAANPNVFPEQLKEVDTWQAKRLVWNFYNRGFTNTPPDDDSDFITMNIGGYNPYLGESYGEIGSRARSMHKSQGFGAGLFRGERMEILKHTKGQPAKEDLFDGVNTTWSRIKGGEIVTKIIIDIKRNFNPEMPAASVPALNQLYKLIQTLPKSPIVDTKLDELENLILRFAGIHLEINASDYNVSPGDELSGTLRVINRSFLKASLNGFEIPKLNYSINSNTVLNEDSRLEVPFKVLVPKSMDISQPYWLKEKHPIGNYVISDESLKGLPLSPPSIIGEIKLNIEGLLLTINLPIDYKYVEPSFGEIYRPLEVSPTITLSPNTSSLVFNSTKSQNILVTVRASEENVKGNVYLELPNGWSYTPKTASFNLSEKNSESVIKFSVIPPKEASEGHILIKANVNGQEFENARNSIKYDHIPQTTTFPKAEIELVKLDLKKKGKKVGYIQGAGDDIPEALKQIGYSVDFLSEEDLSKDLSGYQAILVGIRAYNVHEWLPFYHDKLMTYVKNGGNLIAQYQTSRGSEKFTDKMGPYPFNLTRDRVSEEDAEVRFLNVDEPILNKPNKLGSADFNDWVQERGLYFASDWETNYSGVFSMNDKNESPKSGSLIYTKYGSGNYVYTGISFFRELPAGVSGAYRLMANLISMK